MIKYLKSLLNKFTQATLGKKIITMVLMIVYIAMLFSVAIKVNIEVVTPGTLNRTAYTLSDTQEVGVIKIETENKSGNIYTVGVYSHLRVSLFQYLISNFSKHISQKAYNPKLDLSNKEEIIRGEIHRDFSLIHALIVAYEEASKVNDTIHIEYEFKGLIVSAVLSYSKSGLVPGDYITHINGVKIENLNDFQNKLAAIYHDKAFTLTIIRNNETKTISAQKVLHDEKYKLGFEASEYYIIDREKTTPQFKISEKMPSLGSSGGAMTALAIYNALLNEDITKNKRITGTGTINISGEVGNIGGVQQKIVTATMYNVEIFFVDSIDYNEAKTKYDEIHAGFQLIPVATFADIIQALRGEGHE